MLEIDIIGASNAAVTLYRGVDGKLRQSSEVNVATCLAEKTGGEVKSYIGFTVASVNRYDDCYVDLVKKAKGGDVLILQGVGNDYDMHISLGDMDSDDIICYYGALNEIAKIASKKYKMVIFTLGFKQKSDERYEKYNEAICNIAEKYKFITVTFREHERFKTEEYMPDGVHMSELGAILYADIVSGYIS